ncbi:MAG: polyketide cyclase [Bacteroidales bacterium]|nr:polyketide cyclase [Bacteroidales bacterium]
MNTYESKVVRISRRAEDVFNTLSKFDNFSPMAQGRVENWQADHDSCTFSIKGLTAGLRIVEREEFKTIKITGNELVPMEFYLWIQLKEVAPYDTRMKITAKAELNMMMRMLLGKKLEEGVNSLADGIATAFNSI